MLDGASSTEAQELNPLLRFVPTDPAAFRTTRPEMPLPKLLSFIVEAYQKKVDADRQCIMVHQPRTKLPEFIISIVREDSGSTFSRKYVEKKVKQVLDSTMFHATAVPRVEIFAQLCGLLPIQNPVFHGELSDVAIQLLAWVCDDCKCSVEEIMLPGRMVPVDTAWHAISRLFYDSATSRAWAMAKFRPGCAELGIDLPWCPESRSAIERKLAAALKPAPSAAAMRAKTHRRRTRTRSSSNDGHPQPRPRLSSSATSQPSPDPMYGLSADQLLQICISAWIEEDEFMLSELQTAILKQRNLAEENSLKAQNGGTEPVVDLSADERAGLIRIWEAHGRCAPENLDFEAALNDSDYKVPTCLEAYAPSELSRALKAVIAERNHPDWEEWVWQDEWDWGGLHIIDDEGASDNEGSPAVRTSPGLSPRGGRKAVTGPISQADHDREERPGNVQLDLSHYHIADGSVPSTLPSGLSSLKIRTNTLHAEGANTLLKAIKSREQLLVLDFSGNPIGLPTNRADPRSPATSVLVELLSDSTCAIRELNLRGCMLQGRAVAELIAPIATSRLEGVARSLKILNLADNGIRTNYVTGASCGKGARRTLIGKFQYNFVGQDHFQAIADLLERNIRLLHLDLSWNQLGEVDALRLADALSENSTLLDLNVGVNSMGTRGITGIASALADDMHKSCLTGLDVSFNRVTPAASPKLASVIECCMTLKKLDVSGNRLGYLGTKQLHDALVAVQEEGIRGPVDLKCEMVAGEYHDPIKTYADHVQEREAAAAKKAAAVAGERRRSSGKTRGKSDIT